VDALIPQVRDFRELKVWAKAHDLALATYAATGTFPQSELFGLTAQMRRSCASIATNIAEGCGRDGEAELRRYLSIARGSASELEYQLPLACDLGYLPCDKHEVLTSEVIQIKQMLTRFIQTVSPPRRAGDRRLLADVRATDG
jgi:four helix bundle protein